MTLINIAEGIQPVYPTSYDLQSRDVLTSGLIHKFKVAQLVMELGFSLMHRTQINVIRQRTKLLIVGTISKLKWQRAGHVYRGADGWWNRLVLKWRPSQSKCMVRRSATG